MNIGSTMYLPDLVKDFLFLGPRPRDPSNQLRAVISSMLPHTSSTNALYVLEDGLRSFTFQFMFWGTRSDRYRLNRKWEKDSNHWKQCSTVGHGCPRLRFCWKRFSIWGSVAEHLPKGWKRFPTVEHGVQREISALRNPMPCWPYKIGPIWMCSRFFALLEPPKSNL